MKIKYSCEHCGSAVDELEVDQVDDERFGFSVLNDEERQTLLRYDALTRTMYVQSLCDDCIAAFGLAEERAAGAVICAPRYLH